MGIINLTPDSFSDGGEITTLSALRIRVREFLDNHIEILDVGAESTKPGAEPVPARVQLRRLKPFLKILPEIPVPVSVDTRSSEVARVFLENGAEIINDTSGGSFDPHLPEVVAKFSAVVIVMHMRGTPKSMDQLTRYRDLMGEVEEEWLRAKERFLKAGVKEEKIWFDPGIGFAKTPSQSLSLLLGIERFATKEITVVGHSRKRVMGYVSGENDPQKRDPVSAYFSFLLTLKGVSVLRVHEARMNNLLVQFAHRLKRYAL
jgi:dihydropteroate synthase